MGDVSKVFSFDDRYVVAKLTKATEKGVASIESIRTELEVMVKQDKKADMLSEKIKAASASNIEDLASKLNVQVQSADKINFV